MDDFLEGLAKSYEFKQEDNKKNVQTKRQLQKAVNSLPKELLPVLKKLNLLTKAGVTFTNGQPFIYSILTGEFYGIEYQNYSAIIEIPSKYPCYIYAKTYGNKNVGFKLRTSGGPINISKRYVGQDYLIGTYDNIEELYTNLADYLGKTIGNLGLLDKSIYSKNAQDIIGID